jgi:hypothetical protein
VSAKTKVKHIEPVARVCVEVCCLTCGHYLTEELHYAKAGHTVFYCDGGHCAQRGKRVKVPDIIVKGEWL